MKFQMMVGIPGSGKSTYAKNFLSGTYLSFDDLRDSLGKINIWKEMHEAVEQALSAGEDVVYDATNIKASDRKQALDIARRHGAETIAYVICTPYGECLVQNKRRAAARIVPDDVIRRMKEQYQEPTEDEFDRIIRVRFSPEF